VLPLKLVIDTNVVVSAALKPKGLERTALVFGLTPPARLFVSQDILAEYAEVLSRPELRIPANEQESLLQLIRSRSQLVAPQRKLARLP
jgi:predicted nucleic acid-binding protein